MRFTLIDRVLAVDPGKSITAIKALSLAEEYLGDHFPRFPVTVFKLIAGDHINLTLLSLLTVPRYIRRCVT